EPGKEIVASSVAWDNEPVTITADQALKAADAEGGNDEPTDTDDAVDFLRKLLAGSPLPVKDVEHQANEAGLLGEGKPIGQSKPFRSARKVLDIITDKGGMREGWTWRLPKVPSNPEDALSQTRAPSEPPGTFVRLKPATASIVRSPYSKAGACCGAARHKVE